jgi:hypothetical protein
MRELTLNEIAMVSGAGDECPPSNDIGGITDFSGVGQDLINFYEGLVAATSYMIERVADAL